VETIRTSLVGLRRLFQRRELAELWASAFGDRTRLDYTMLRLLDAVGVSQAAGGDGEGGGGATTVGDIARLLGIDPSRASRQVQSAVAAGLLVRRAAQDDGRKVVLVITARGARLQARGSQVTRNRIALALEQWPEGDRQQLALLLGRFVDHMLRDVR
jgi:DNA-binding MarR family transcriptional regulator